MLLRLPFTRGRVRGPAPLENRQPLPLLADGGRRPGLTDFGSAAPAVVPTDRITEPEVPPVDTPLDSVTAPEEPDAATWPLARLLRDESQRFAHVHERLSLQTRS